MLPGSPASPYSKFWGAPFLAPFARSGAFPVGRVGHPFRQNYIRDYGGGAPSIPRFLRNLRKVGDDAACSPHLVFTPSLSACYPQKVRKENQNQDRSALG